MEHEDGSQVYVELLGFWRAQYLQSRLEMIEAQGWPLLVLVGERMRAERGKSAASEHPHVIMFKGVVKLESLVSAADRFRESGALPVAKSAPKRRGRKKKEA
jgi:predicted nuclease of restriction endonuclease-like RecB superfamily